MADKNIANSFKKLFIHKCNIYKFLSQQDPESKATYQQLSLVYENLDCGISYFNKSSINTIKSNNYYNESTQYIKLFLDKNINIPPGSMVKIFRDNSLVDYFQCSSKPYFYLYHQEVLLKSRSKFS